MSKPARASHPLYNLLPTEIEGFDSLAELALDMRWSWNHATDEVWRQLDPDLWEITHNPWVVLQTASRDRIEQRVGRSRFPEKRGWSGGSQPAGGGSARVVSEESCAGSADLRRVFQHGVHVERSSAHLFGRAGQCGRRSTQSRQRSGRAGGRRGTALPAGLFSPGDRQERRAAGPLPVQRSRTIADHALAPAKRGVAAVGNRVAWILGLAARLAGAGRQGEALPAGQQRRGQLSRSSRDHQRALWRRAGVAPQAGNAAGDRRMAAAARAGAPAGGLSPE